MSKKDAHLLEQLVAAGDGDSASRAGMEERRVAAEAAARERRYRQTCEALWKLWREKERLDYAIMSLRQTKASLLRAIRADQAAAGGNDDYTNRPSHIDPTRPTE